NGKASSANPDNGIIGSPSSYSPSLAVANFDGKIGNQCIADTSSRGVSNTMLLKPDIAGIGTSVNSSGVGGKYGTMSGTSMASPNVAGALIAIEQYCMQTPQIAALLPAERKKAAKNMAIKLIMSTAEILKQTNSTQPLIDGIAYSPRAQGAGIANLDRAIKSKAYIQTNNVDNRPKIDGQAMAKSDGIYQFEFDIVNMSTTPLQYNVEVETITEFISNKLMSGLDRKLSPTLQISTNGGSTFDALLPATVVNVAAEATQKVVVKISLTPGDKTILSECPNGMFVEGFVKLKQVVGSESNLSMPFVAYYGQWTTAGDVLDATYYDVKNGVKNAVVRPTTLYAHYQNDNVPIGDYLYTLKSTEK
ncbi:MAG: S8 family serine peptidase, partial [Clostridia bacterium]